MMCQESAAWDVEVRSRGIHVPICDDHKKEAVIALSRRGELVVREVKDVPKACQYDIDCE